MRETNSIEDEGQCDDVPRCEGAEATGVGGEDRKGGEPYHHGFEEVFVQKKIETRNIINVISVPTAVIDAVVFSSEDKQKSVALVRGRQASDDDDGEIFVPSAAASVSHSSDIVDVMC